ncbi:uncharacterized protein LOC143616805 [Bidens hawaiensis]|uniref:uncharacterized protein LOC143616805 n=1 Tax=Bidens hawaiensis TaxID=980011 RepID=UPI00404B6991
MSDQQPPVEDQTNGGAAVIGPPVTLQPDAAAAPPLKRQRRPSVRLGDIGDQHIYDNTRRTKQPQWKFPAKDSRSSKTRPLVNLTGTGEFQDSGEDKDGRNESCHNNNNVNNGGNDNNNNNNNNDDVIGSWKARACSKLKRGFSGTKRVRSNWGLKMDDSDDFDHDDNDDDVQSLNFSMDNEMDLNYGGKETGTGARVRVSDGVELDGPSDTDARNWNNNSNPERNGVRVWLNQLGLGRYAPVFEVHEVDDEVLPLLTLEDLKDMGINAVGSRRKMFCSIQKLGKGFS